MARLILALLVAAFALLGESATLGGRKALAPSPDSLDLAPSPNSLDLPPLDPIDLGFTPLNTKDPKVIQLANFAIDEYNKAHNAKIVLYAVFEAISTTDKEGTNYGLYVAATNGADLGTYHMNVSVANNVKKLISFAPLA